MKSELRWHSPFWHSGFSILPIVLTLVWLLAPLTMITWRSFVPPETPVQFLRIDFKTPETLFARFQTHSEPLSAFLWRNFSDKGKELLASRGIENQQMVDILVAELGSIVNGFTNSIYSSELFTNVDLSAMTKRLLREPSVRNYALLNRCLLEDAYPKEIGRGRRATRGFEVAFQPYRMVTYSSVFRRAFMVATMDALLAVPFAFLLCAYTRPIWSGRILLVLTVPFLINESIRAYAWRSVFQFLHISLQGEGALMFVQVVTTLIFCIFPVYFVAIHTLRNSWVVCNDLDISMIRRFFLVFLPLSARGACMGWVGCFSLAISATAEPAILMRPQQQSFGNEVRALWSASEPSAAAALALSVCLFVGLSVFVFYLLAKVPIWSLVFRIVDSIGHRISLFVAPRFAPVHESRFWSSLGHFLRIGLIVIVLSIGVLPIGVTVSKSFNPVSVGHSDPFHWYKDLVLNSDFLEGIRNSVLLALPVGAATVVIAYFLGYTVWRSRVFLLTAFCLCFLVFLPASAYALGIAEVQKWLGAREAHLWVLGLCQIGSFLPFCFVVVVVSQVMVEPSLMGACMELGATRLRLVLAVVPRMVWPIITSSLLVGVLLSINDYTRPEFLGGSTRLLSRQVNSQLQSSGDYTGYAAGSVLTLLAVLTIICLWFATRRSEEPPGR